VQDTLQSFFADLLRCTAGAQVRVRTTILMVREIDLVKQTFTCKFFLEGARCPTLF
jgi:hypothetical protein